LEKRSLSLLVSLFLVSFISAGQVKEDQVTRILMQGVVMDAKTMAPLPNSQIWVNRAFSAVSNSDGSFAFYVKTRDTLLFTNLGYSSQSLIIGDSLAAKQYMAGIYMNSDTLSIGEVVILPRNINLRSDILNAKSKVPPEMENAKYNVAVSAYQGRTTTGSLGDPSSNYELLRQRQKTDAYEKGGIPSDKMVGLSPFMLLPAAYLLLHGLPEKPPALKPDISDYELDQLNRKFLEKLK
jgi:hypothetical protein